jgi:hypothetical protein
MEFINSKWQLLTRGIKALGKNIFTDNKKL